MNCYLINLERSKDRLEWFMANVPDVATNFERVDAVDGRLIDQGAYDNFASSARPGARRLTPSELGCLLSHRKVWERIVKIGEEWAFVAEDDINFSDDAAEFLRSDLWIPVGADIVKAETNLQKQKLSYRPEALFMNHGIHRLLSDHDRSGGYFISKSAAERMLEVSTKHFVPLDVLLFSCSNHLYHSMSVFQVAPAICIQDELFDERPENERLGSTIDMDMPRAPKASKASVNGGAKFLREIRRLGSQVIYLTVRAKCYLCREDIVRRIPFGPKS